MNANIESMNEQLTEAASRIIRDRVSQWVRYTFEKEWLPHIVREIEAEVHVQIVNTMDYHGFKVSVTYTPQAKGASK